MFDRKNSNHSKEIINWFYNQEFDPQTEARLRELFMLWLTDMENEAEKETALDALIERELFTEEINSQDNAELKEAFEQLLIKLKEHPISSSTQQENKKESEIKRLPLPRNLLKYAAIILPAAVLLGGWIVLRNINKEYRQEWITAKGKTESVTLPDSTYITLNSETRLNVVLNKRERIANLSGGGYFSVMKDKKRPFKVTANDLTVQVFGTEFSIEAYPNEPLTLITLTKGKVSLTSISGEGWALTPGQMFVYDNEKGSGQILNLTSQEIADVSSRRGGSLGEGHNENKYRYLGDIFKILEHRYSIKMIIDSSITLFDNEYLIQINPGDTPEMILDALEILTDRFNYRTENSVYYINPPETILKTL